MQVSLLRVLLPSYSPNSRTPLALDTEAGREHPWCPREAGFQVQLGSK